MEMEWKEQDKNDFIALYKNYILRVEQMGPQKWWWAEIELDMDEFHLEKDFGDELFGYWRGVYISIKK